MTTPTDDLQRIQQVYSTVYRPDPADRSYAWHPRNPVSLAYRQAQERALIRLLDNAGLALETADVLDVGCGGGGLLRTLASLGADPARLHGLDLMPERVAQARALCPPAVTLQAGNAARLPYGDGRFDLVCQFTVFSSIFDPALRRQVAAEMQRVLRPGGHILWYDLRRGHTATTHGLEEAEVRNLFTGCQVIAARSLHPLKGSALARRSLLLFDLAGRLPLPKTHALLLLRR